MSFVKVFTFMEVKFIFIWKVVSGFILKQSGELKRQLREIVYLPFVFTSKEKSDKKCKQENDVIQWFLGPEGGNLLSYFIPSDRVYDNNTALPVVLALNYVIHASRNLFTNLESSGSSKPVNKWRCHASLSNAGLHMIDYVMCYLSDHMNNHWKSKYAFPLTK